jgi:DNA-binding NtrC family response regulator
MEDTTTIREGVIDSQKPEPTTATGLQPETLGYSALMAEDDPHMSVILYEVLQCIDPNIRVENFSSAEDAAKRLSIKAQINPSHPYSFMIVDIFLSGKETGLDLCNYSQKTFPELPIIITSIMPPSSIREAYQDKTPLPDFLSKPFTVKECFDFFNNFLIIHGLKTPNTKA